MSVIEADGERLLLVVRRLLGEKGIVAPDEIAERARLTAAASPAQGARMVAKAWVRSRLTAP